MGDVAEREIGRSRSPGLVVLVNIGVLACLVVAMELASFLLMASLPTLSGLLRNRSFNGIGVDGRVGSAAYSDHEYAKRVFADYERLQDAYEPYAVWKSAPVSSETLNIDASGVRRTCHNQPGGVRVFMFGGSTLFGTGVDDCATIASFVARDLNARRLGVEVFNFGTSGHQSTQELILLMRELRRGNIPAVAVFYDGVNDTYAGAYSPGIPGAHQNLDIIAGRFTQGFLTRMASASQTYRALRYMQERFTMRQSPLDETELAADARGTVAAYLHNVAVVRSLADAFHFRSLAIWQPVLLASNKPRTEQEQGIADASGSLAHAYSTVYAAMRREPRAERGVVDVSAALDGVRDQLYLDFSHLGPAGNELVARAIAESIANAGVLPPRPDTPQ